MTNSEANTGWADAMSKILVVKKPPKNKTIILSKGKKLSLMKKEKIEDENTNDDQKKVNCILKKNEIYMKGRTKPNVLEKDKEKKLQKITVKGVVKLFNAVNKHQQSERGKLDNSGPVITQKEKMMNSVSKSTFLNYLIGEVKNEEALTLDGTKMEIKEEKESQQLPSNSTWEVLQSNYGIGVKMKNWDSKPIEEIDIM